MITYLAIGATLTAATLLDIERRGGWRPLPQADMPGLAATFAFGTVAWAPIGALWAVSEYDERRNGGRWFRAFRNRWVPDLDRGRR